MVALVVTMHLVFSALQDLMVASGSAGLAEAVMTVVVVGVAACLAVVAGLLGSTELAEEAGAPS